MAEIDKTQTDPGSGEWEREIIGRLALAAIEEQRRTRRWNIFFKSLLFGYLLLLLVLAFGEGFGGGEPKGPHSSMVEIEGTISASTEANAESIIKGLRDAFEDDDSQGVILRINSPGGSPVQSSYVYEEIRRLRVKNPDIPVYAVVTDIGASGAYYIAAAADKIFVNPSSVVGSIGVLMNGFGFVETMEKLGVERRLLTAGEHKGMLDPFSPLSPAEVEHTREMLQQVHQQFITAVKQGRGERLKNSPDLFSGLFWSGEQSIELGLADEFGTPDSIAREVIGAEQIINYTRRPALLERLADRFGASVGRGLAAELGFTQGVLR